MKQEVNTVVTCSKLILPLKGAEAQRIGRKKKIFHTKALRREDEYKRRYFSQRLKDTKMNLTENEISKIAVDVVINLQEKMNTKEDISHKGAKAQRHKDEFNRK